MIARDLFPDPVARALLVANGLSDFDAWWSLPVDWHEEPNERRGGWSGVSRCVLADGTAVFLKRQENHLCRTLRHPWRGIPTFYREYQNIARLRERRIAAVEALYYGDRRMGGKWRAILVTRALDSFVSLDDWNAAPENADPERRRALIDAVAQACARLHRHRWQHSCLYGKHLFVPRVAPTPPTYRHDDIRFIDLEKLRQGFSRHRVGAHDLDQLMRHTPGWSETEKTLFKTAYRRWQTAEDRQATDER
ncbi:MAG TPA: lipopolysaccharide kinase InaA family protein [Accumulibacter sp.]|nr:lipopolysaccharide kinase InaA family protein [Accumulibacter sp.]HQC80147.1 lipopolysaccharide kinase InaA family protein [Accumulibacter sp.]